MFFGGLTIAINGFSMVFLFFYHRFQWFSMVPDHWSNNAMVSMDRHGLFVGEFSGENCWLLLKSSPDLVPRPEQFKDTSVDYSQLSGFHETKEYKNRGENSYNNVLVEDRNFYQMEVTNIWCSPSYTYLKLDTDTFGRGRGNIRQLLGRHLQGGFWFW